ncbi:4-hydroxy-tetrahydrodipicolinate synthase [Micavibrio aeruginosavorus]|uniref:4-hydroxy-tetrahydrodipicolinate synthase n=1 Tax=Micavibrio aeruginosavorus (strain ARL-13) TaxID=856793 RepID=G2KRP3_MICAA|nr:4-hydroxy-tetrahydrodipicolinate synthase [Micavibrio aeruginosavorus]AEP10001.1 dihydrodipicolinate synthase [Micavibrio aeruginosavorus ARL-13]
MPNIRFRGAMTALITPFVNNAVDWKAYDDLVEWQVEQGIHGVVACGTTGESPTLTKDEHKSIVERTVAVVKGRVPVIAGTGSYSTDLSIETTLFAQNAGADAALVVTPYYNKPTQDGLFAHFKAIHDATNIPILIYNIPGRSVVDMTNDTMVRLAELPRIAGVKDATGQLDRPTLIKARVKDDFCLISGDDGSAPGYLAQGGHGVISVISNLAPRDSAAMQDAWVAGDLKTFAALRDKLAPLCRATMIETSPAPVKYGAARMGLCRDEVRLPLVPATTNARAVMDEAMEKAGLISAGSGTIVRAHG